MPPSISGNVPPDLRAALDSLKSAAPANRETFCYLYVLALIDDHKAVEVGRRTVDGKELISVRTVAGEEFEIVHPPLTGEQEKGYRTFARNYRGLPPPDHLPLLARLLARVPIPLLMLVLELTALAIVLAISYWLGWS